jgi:site-specific recombinase XerD
MTQPARSHRPIEILAPGDVLALMQKCSRRAPTGVRHRALIALLYGSGLRISEALALHARDVDLDGLAVTVHAGKGARRRVSALLPDAADAVQRWLDRRVELGLSGQHVLFCTIGRGAAGRHPTKPGGALTREYVARVLRRLAKRAGIDKRVHPHGFRHSHADLLRRRGFDMEELRKQLGHRSLHVTGLYLDHLGSHDLPERIRSVGPVFEPQDKRKELGELLSQLSEPDVTQLLAILKRAPRRRSEAS